MATHITTLVYAQRDDSIVLIRRRKPPNLGLWSPPGGKIEPDESPLENACRELEEETGLRAPDPRLAVVVSEIDLATAERWIMFVFRETSPTGDIGPGSDEGRPVWVPIDDVTRKATPPADPYILEAVRAANEGVAFLHVTFDGGRLLDVRTSEPRP